MGIYDAMNSSVTGMNAQSNYLTNIGQNISNSSTVGYKQADTEFSTLVDQADVGQTAAGGVYTTTRLDVAAQGTLEGTTSATDLAVKGEGYFVVSDSGGQTFLTRSGSFVPDSSGNLVNAAGYYLMGYAYSSSGTLPAMSSNSLTGMTKVNVGTGGVLPAAATTSGTFSANLPSTDTTGTGAVSSTNYTEQTSITMYDSQGTAENVDVYFLKTGANTWTTAAYIGSTALTSSTTPASLAFTNAGTLTGGSASMSITVPNASGTGSNAVTLDLSGMTQYATAYSVSKSTVTGNAASAVSSVTIGTDGTLSYQLADGSTVPEYKIPLANVASPDNMLPVTGNAFSPNLLSGQATVGVAGSGSLGTINSDNLEESTVDVATELTNMIVAQRNYQANSKMFSTAAQCMDTLVNLQV
jgi:flagellar hook protein FlgE